MTEADDVTELSQRKRGGEPEDVTRVARRDRRAPAVPDDPAEDDTKVSSRQRGDGTETRDATRLVRRPTDAEHPTPRRRRLSPLPPGAIGGAAAERGVFGTPAQEYAPRDAPANVAAAVDTKAAPVPEETGAPDPSKVRARREALRHRRLITAAIVVGITAAVMTAAIIGIIALANGQG